MVIHLVGLGHLHPRESCNTLPQTVLSCLPVRVLRTMDSAHRVHDPDPENGGEGCLPTCVGSTMVVTILFLLTALFYTTVVPLCNKIAQLKGVGSRASFWRQTISYR